MPTTRVRNPIFARLYPRMNRAMDHGGFADHRAALLAGLTGPVLEVGAGTGANFPHYPPTVTRVTAVEPEPRLRATARRAAEQAPVPVEVVDGLAEALPSGDGSVAAVVVTLVLCSVRDQASALLEIHRVLAPSGQLRFLEHVRADSPGLARVQRLLDATVWPHLVGGCHLGRDTAAAIEHAGLRIAELDRFLFPAARTPVSFHIRGAAVK